jgi:hypothetical protein
MVAQSVAAILADHVRLSVECIDRMYLNVYVPRLQREKDAAWFFRGHRRQPLASSVLMAPISRRFVAGLERYAGGTRSRWCSCVPASVRGDGRAAEALR